MNVRTPVSMGIIAAAFWLSSPIFISRFSAKNPTEGEFSASPGPQPNDLQSDRLRSPGPELMDGNTIRTQASSSLSEMGFNDAVSNHPPLQTAPVAGSVPTLEFFRKTQSNPPVRFDLVIPRFTAGGPCNRSSSELEKSFQDSFSRHTPNVNSFVPDSARIIDLNYYMHFRGKYYQLSLEPISESLERYQLTLIQSSTPDFAVNVERFVFGRLDPLQQFPNQDEAVAELQKLIGEYTSQGARWGTRTAVLTNKPVTKQSETSENSIFRIEMHDGHVHGFMNHQQECHLDKDERLDCRCW